MFKRLIDEIEVFVCSEDFPLVKDGRLNVDVMDKDIAKYKAKARNQGKWYMEQKQKEWEKKKKHWKTRLFGDLF